MNEIKKVDNIVIGSGPAGRLASFELGKLGEEVLLIEKHHIGGTCCDEGCMVVCGLTDIARFLKNFKRFENLGFINGTLDFSYAKASEKIRETQKIFRKINQSENEAVNNKIIYGVASIEKADEDMILVKVKENETKEESLYQANKLLIATGAKVKIPNIKGTEYAITSSDILNLKELPETINIIGGGIIASELSNIFSSFGCKVNMIIRSSLLKELDEDIKEYVVTNLLKDINILEKTDTYEIKENSIITSKGELNGKTLIATGRIPNTEIIADFVELNEDKSIKVNEFMQSSNKNIYAAGDCIGGVNLTPIARKEGICAARNMAGYLNKIENTIIPQSLTLDLDVSFIKEQNDYFNNESLDNKNNNKDKIVTTDENINTIKIPGIAGANSFWRVLDRDTGITKVSINEETGEIKKASSISPSSVDDTAYLAFLIKNGFEKDDFDDFLETHPSNDTYYKILKLI